MKNGSAMFSPMRGHQFRKFAHPSWICNHCRNSHSAVSPSVSPQFLRNGRPRHDIPNSPARTRFAPSPTGYLHLGSLRTALFNYLFAKRTGGQFLLRVEDTDQKRTIPGAEERLYEDLEWAGLQWDEGPNVGGPYGPYRQSERTAIYQSHAHQLVSTGHAYRCFCSTERLDNLSKHRLAAGLPLGYDRKCVDISPDEAEERAMNGETHVVRLKTNGYPMFHDIVYGKTGQNQSREGRKLEFLDRVYDDPILLKSDGHPTYHLANVVDDHLMEITHVIRGTEWMASTPMHVALYDAFGWSIPQFAHVPLLVDKNGQKLSKRNADIDVSFYRERQGLLPEALINFAALLGWSHSQKSDIFTLGELEQIFTPKITKGNTVVAFEKLWYLQKAHVQRVAADGGQRFDDLTESIATAAEKKWSKQILGPLLRGRSLKDHVALLLRADAKSFTNTDGFLARNATFFMPTIQRANYIPASNRDLSSPIPLSALHTAAAALSLVPESHWTIEIHRSNISSYNAETSIPDSTSSSSSTTSTLAASPEVTNPKEPVNGTASPATPQKAGATTDKIFKKELYHYLRWALSAGAPGPGIPETMAILGRNETLRRLDDARQLTLPAAKASLGANMSSLRRSSPQSLGERDEKVIPLVEKSTSKIPAAATTDCT